MTDPRGTHCQQQAEHAQQELAALVPELRRSLRTARQELRRGLTTAQEVLQELRTRKSAPRQ